MIVKTLRDAEFALNALEKKLDGIVARSQSDLVTLAQVKNLVGQANKVQIVRQEVLQNASQFDLTDVDATPSEGQILHRLIHLFYNEVRFAKTIRLVDGFIQYDGASAYWKTNIGTLNPYGGAAANYQIRYTDPGFPANNFEFFLAPGTGLFVTEGIIPLTDATKNIGNSSLAWKSGYFGEHLWLSTYSATAATQNFIVIDRVRGTKAAPTSVAANDSVGGVLFRAYRAGNQLGASILSVVTSLPSASTIAANLRFATANLSGTYDYRWELTPDGHWVPFFNAASDVGSSTNRVSKIWAVDIDFSGTIAGTLPASDANTQLNANASAGLTVTTSFADVTGATVSLNKNGNWLVTCAVVGSKELNDDEIQGQLVYDGTAQTGIIRMAASTANFIRTTGTRSWIINVTSQPKTAKIQCKKNAGTGTSSVDPTNTNIVAVFLTT